MSGFDTDSITKSYSSVNISNSSTKPGNGMVHSNSTIINGRRTSKVNQQDFCFISSIEDYVHKFCGNRVIKKVNILAALSM
jgi:hypothetical protein